VKNAAARIVCQASLLHDAITPLVTCALQSRLQDCRPLL